MFILLRKLFYILFFISLFSCAITGGTGALTKKEVENFVGIVDESFKRKDVKTISDNAWDSLEVFAKINNQEIKYTKEQYLALLTEGWARAESYSYQKLSSSINISNHNKAIVQRLRGRVLT